jgi:hypothetical protein
MHIGSGVRSSCFLSSDLKSSQFMFQKFRIGLAFIVVTARLSSMQTGKWSVLMPLSPGCILQEIIEVFK